MKFLIEKSILDIDDVSKFNRLTTNQKTKYIDNYLKNINSNKKNLSKASYVYNKNLMQKGFDDAKNPLIYFMNNVPRDVSGDFVELVSTLIDEDKLDVKSKWLYKPSLYTEANDDMIFKLKALVYASNKDLQTNSNRQITPESLMSKSGNILKKEEIDKILNRIQVNDSASTIQNAIDRLYGYLNLNNSNNVTKLKNKFRKIIKDSKRYNPNMDILIDNIDIKELIRIPIKNTTEKGIANGIVDYFLGNTKLYSDTKSKRLDITQIAKKYDIPEEQVRRVINKVTTNSSVVVNQLITALTDMGITKSDAEYIVDNTYEDGMSFEDAMMASLKGYEK